ncbi:GNAT family N-acetyltransferase [Sphingomonas sp. 28-63-12]|uniref:GNAT family N-acetyltransferase n=1 Tax=Sphingomonas sp. 28-63-12 TaxID=1970434 RepID=UPI000BC443C4|nr:MAG: hypothetical protein B7Y47_11525 [Sphingomonas sp. 28-63-12]
MTDLLDRPIWSALTTSQTNFAVGGPLALRFDPAVNVLAAVIDDSPAALAALGALLPAGGQLGMVGANPLPLVAGTVVARQAVLCQMVADAPLTGIMMPDAVELGDADAPEMLALAALTRPGPFLIGTHRLGHFLGIRANGQLVAMAGERMRMPGFTEVSAVCTHPDWRGHGLAAALTCAIVGRIQARGDAAFLHAYPDNPAAGLYQRLGFRVRRTLIHTLLQR